MWTQKEESLYCYRQIQIDIEQIDIDIDNKYYYYKCYFFTLTNKKLLNN